MRFIYSSVLVLLTCWCFSVFAAEAPAATDHSMHDMSAGHDMDMGGDMSLTEVSQTGMVGMRPTFELVNHAGELVRSEAFRGKNVLLAFGFTHCLHVCPLIAANMAKTLKIADKDAVGIFISVDNERDSPSRTHQYATSFGPTMIGLSGNYEQLSAAAKSFNTTFVVTKTQDSYTVQHSPNIFLIAPDGDIIDVFAINSNPDDIAASMK